MAAEQAINSFISVDAINAGLSAVFEGGARPYAIHLSAQESYCLLEYWTGALEEDLYYTDQLVGSQAGEALGEACDSSYGLGTFFFSTEVGVRDPQPLGFEIYEARTEILHSESALSALTGGGVKITALSDLVEAVLVSLDDAGALPEGFDIDATVASTEATLLGASDITCDGGDSCFSITFEYDALPVEVAP